MRTYSPKPGDADKKWYVIDATDVVLGRLAAKVADILRGKHKPSLLRRTISTDEAGCDGGFV